MSNVGLCAAMMKRSMSLAGVLLVAVRARGGPVWPGCAGCHNQTKAMGGLDLGALPFHLTNRATRERWIRIHDRVQKGEMPPKGATFPAAQRAAMVKRLAASIHGADQAEIARQDPCTLRRMRRRFRRRMVVVRRRSRGSARLGGAPG